MLRTLASALFCVSAGLPAQQMVCARGLVERRQSVSLCSVSHTHRFQCGGLVLQSSTVNLSPYEGQIAEVCGLLTSLGNCRLISVVSVNPTGFPRLQISGPVAFQIPRGQIAQFDLRGAPAQVWVTLYSNRVGLTDLGPFGLFLLNPRSFFLAQGLLDGVGQASFPVPIPNDPALANVWLYFQTAFVDLATLGVSLGNTDCFQIQ